jgi:hypothetical protein
MADEQQNLQPLPDTLRVIYEHTRGGPAAQLAAADKIDAKAFQVFSAATVVLGLGTFATVHRHHHAAAVVLYAVAAAAYACAAISTWRVVRTREYQVVEGASRWWPSHELAKPDYVLGQLIRTLAQADAYNRKLLDTQGKPLDWLLGWVAGEALFVAAAVIAALV